MKFFIELVATTFVLSPSRYAARKLSPKTSTSISIAISTFARPVKADSGTGVSPVSGAA